MTSRLGGGWTGSNESPGGRASERLKGELARADLARHLAFFYRSRETQLDIAATFIEYGLQSNKRCLYFVDGNTRADIEAALRARGIDVEAREAAGDLRIERGEEAYGAAQFDPGALIDQLANESDRSVTDGYDELWVAGETTWCFHGDDAYDVIVDFEADFDARCPDLPVTALCQYDVERFSEESVAKALRTHEQIIYQHTICENPFYVPPEEYRTGAEPFDTQLPLDQLHRLSETERRVDRQEQRLSVVNRILRHNIRNKLNVARGVADLLVDTNDIGGGHQERLHTAIASLDEVLDLAEKARHVEQTIDQSDIGQHSLGTFVTAARNQVVAAYPDAEVTVEGDTELTILADTNLEEAFAELFLYAFRNQEGSPPTATVAVSTPAPERVCVDIRFPGPPVPNTDRETLRAGVETQLQHCNGLGLWLVNWLVENSHGALIVPEDGDPQFRLEFYRTGE